MNDIKIELAEWAVILLAIFCGWVAWNIFSIYDELEELRYLQVRFETLEMAVRWGVK